MKKLYLVELLLKDGNPEVVETTEVKLCLECGCLFVKRPYRLGQCPMGHDQPKKARNLNE
jgi:hypothetical protein